MFDDLNIYPQAANIIHGRDMTDEEKSEVKGLYLEGLINFMKVYAETEICPEVELDITKISMFVNSAVFENEDAYSISSVDDVYEILTELTLRGLPVWRFLRLSPYQENLFEKNWQRENSKRLEEVKRLRTCYGCIWYTSHETIFGVLEECEKPSTEFKRSRNSEEFEKREGCKFFTGIEGEIPNTFGSLWLPDRKNLPEKVQKRREKMAEELLKDPFRIPKGNCPTEVDAIKTREENELLMDFARVCGNKKPRSQEREELRRAMYVESMIRFFDIFAQTEIGNDFKADIRRISRWVDEIEYDVFNRISSYEDVYNEIEKNLISRQIKAKDFIQKKETSR